jgi:hypothetical protein
MRDHPLTPMTDANLVRVLARQSQFPVGLVAFDDVERGSAAMRARFAALEQRGHRVAIVDAVLDRHLDAIGCACQDFPLVTGGAALGGALARAALRARTPVETPPASPRSGLVAVLSGSGSAATLAQVRRLAASVAHRSIDPVALARDAGALPSIVEWAQQHVRRGPVLMYSTALPRGRSERSAQARPRPGRRRARAGLRCIGSSAGRTGRSPVHRGGRRDIGRRAPRARYQTACLWRGDRSWCAVDAQSRSKGISPRVEVRKFRWSGFLHQGAGRDDGRSGTRGAGAPWPFAVRARIQLWHIGQS